MSSLVEIFNTALAMVGEDQITDPDEDSEPARKCRLLWPGVRDATLRAHPWNFALHPYSVAADATAPAFEWARSFTLPPDPFCLRVWRTYPAGAVHKVIGRKIYTNEGAPFRFWGIRRVTDTGLYDACFVQAGAARLGFKMSPRLTESRTKTKDLWDVYLAQLSEARSIDAQEGSPEAPEESEFLLSRY